MNNPQEQIKPLSIQEIAEIESNLWEPFTKNHSPDFIKALRNAFSYGFARGWTAKEDAK